MISLKKHKIILLSGSAIIEKQPIPIFHQTILNFLSELSKLILNETRLTKYNDLKSFAFWCRENNMKNKQSKYDDEYTKKGIGLVLHIPPSNTPMAAAYSFVFGLLSGNSNIVRISDPNIDSIKELIKIINKILKKKKFENIRKNNSLIYYTKDSSVSEILSGIIDARIVWGSEKTIEYFKGIKTKNHCKDVFFGDKYSISIIDVKMFFQLSSKKKTIFIQNFYNDTFIMDQNACSSPHTIFWLNSNKKLKDLFWNKLNDHVTKKYDFTKEIQNHKYSRLNKILLKYHFLHETQNLFRINVFKIKNLTEPISDLRGLAGIFFEYDINNIKEIKRIINERCQTITYFGIKKKILTSLINNHDIVGINRVIPVGQAIDMDLIWDGKNLINELSRIIEVK